MKTIYFKCTLLTDIIINQKAATEGNQKTLDFIPGNNFLGVAASGLYYKKNKTGRLDEEESLKVFHSGKIKFGDAHPAEVVSTEDGKELMKRSVRIPAAYYRPKLNNKEGFYIYHEVKDHDDEAYRNFQPKQCRTGFYVFEKNTFKEIEVEKTFAIKSAYDRVARHSANEKMFGYESLLANSVWVFDVSMEDPSFEAEIREALVGTRRIGRSRTAQYGLVEIEETTEPFTNITKMPDNPDYALVYADSRLIFLDEFGMPTFSPDPEKDFGFIGGEIDWTKTQIRTFQYAPWNARRQTRDADRCGIEKGSVFYIIPKEGVNELIYPEETFVGKYQNEGFGRIIINPEFLKAKEGENGKALFSLLKTNNENKNTEENDSEKKNKEVCEHPLYTYLVNKKAAVNKERIIYKLVNNFVDNKSNVAAFAGEQFASQWGAIRNIAMLSENRSDLCTKLFGNKGYLMHGVAKLKWEEQGRLRRFKDFFENLPKDKEFTDRDVRSAIINLAAEMAKISGRK